MSLLREISKIVLRKVISPYSTFLLITQIKIHLLQSEFYSGE